MNNSEIENNVIGLIKNGKTGKAIECLQKNITSKELKKDLLSLSSRLSRNNKDFLGGLIIQEEKRTVENRIVKALIHCLGELSDSKELISKNSIQDERIGLLVASIELRRKRREFRERGSEKLKKVALKIIEDVILKLNAIKASHDEITFFINEDRKEDFEIHLIWKHPIDNQNKMLIVNLTDGNNVSKSKLILTMYNKEIECYKSISHNVRLFESFQQPQLNQNDEVYWLDKEAIRNRYTRFSGSEITQRFIKLFLENYDAKRLLK